MLGTNGDWWTRHPAITAVIAVMVIALPAVLLARRSWRQWRAELALRSIRIEGLRDLSFAIVWILLVVVLAAPLGDDTDLKGSIISWTVLAAALAIGAIHVAVVKTRRWERRLDDTSPLAAQARNLGVDRPRTWSRTSGVSIVDDPERRDARCLVVDLGSLDGCEEQALVAAIRIAGEGRRPASLVSRGEPATPARAPQARRSRRPASRPPDRAPARSRR